LGGAVLALTSKYCNDWLYATGPGVFETKGFPINPVPKKDTLNGAYVTQYNVVLVEGLQ